MLYEIIQVLVAFIAVVLAVKWKKTEFLAGLSFLFIYAFLDMIDVYFFTITQGVYLDVAQFGFILLASIFFIIGMHNSLSHIRGRRKPGKNPPAGTLFFLCSEKYDSFIDGGYYRMRVKGKGPEIDIPRIAAPCQISGPVRTGPRLLQDYLPAF